MRLIANGLLVVSLITALSCASEAAYNPPTWTVDPSIQLSTPYPILSYATPAEFGAVCNGVQGTDGAISAASQSFSSAATIFSPADVGKSIAINGAGSGDGLETTISSFVSTHVVTIAVAASTTVSGATFEYGTVETAKIQSWLNALTTRNLIGLLPSGLCGIGVLTEHGSSTIQGTGPASGFLLFGANAGIGRDQNFSYLNWSNFSFVGNGVFADLQNPIQSTVGFTISSGSFIGITSQNVNDALDLTRVNNAVVTGGTFGPTLGDGSAPGTGYCVVVGNPDGVVRAARISDNVFYRCTRHDVYVSAGEVVSSSNNQFVQHRFGLPFTGEFASLELSRGASFSDVGSSFYDCYDSPFGLDNDSAFGHAATAFSTSGETVNNCPFPGYVGEQNTGSPTIDNDSVSITGLNWHAAANSGGSQPNGEAIIVYGCNVCRINGTFDFSNSPNLSANVLPIVLHNVQDRGPFGLTIDATARIATTGSNNALVEIGTEQAASGSTAEVFITPSSKVIGARLLSPDAEIQNAGIVAPGNPDVKNISGATPYVSGYVNFNLTQVGGVNVTNFLGGSQNQIISVVAGDSNTTFIQGTTLKLKTGANTPGVINVAYTFRDIGGVWYQQ